jgi:hypothetical protein
VLHLTQGAFLIKITLPLAVKVAGRMQGRGTRKNAATATAKQKADAQHCPFPSFLG